MARLGNTSATVALLAVAAAGVVCCRWRGTTWDDVQEVRATIESLIAADNDGDVDAIVSHYAPDAVLLPPAGPPVHGRDEIRRRYRAGLERFALEVTVGIDQARVSGRWAYSRGTTEGRYVWRDGSAPTDFEDKYLMILEQEGGAWRVSVLMWSPVATEHDPDP